MAKSRLDLYNRGGRVGVEEVELPEESVGVQIPRRRTLPRQIRPQAELLSDDSHETVAGGGLLRGHLAADEHEVDPLYPVALLKIAMAMKRLPPKEELHFERLLDEVLSDLVLDRDHFGEYLQQHMGRLMAAVRSRGY